jgi:small subunit ribosomal protein S6
MLRYEVLVLTVPEITQDESKNFEMALDKKVQEVKGAIVSHERWGKYRLAYPVRKNDYGVYFLTRFEVPNGTDIVKELQTMIEIKWQELIMRSVFTRLEAEASLEYQRPKSLEEAPSSRDVKSFLKENKMEGLLSSVEDDVDDFDGDEDAHA